MSLYQADNRCRNVLLIYIIKISHFPQYCTQLFTNQTAVTNNTTTSEQCENPVVYMCLIHLCLSESKIYGYSSFSIVTTYKWMVMFMARLTHTYSFRHIDVIKMHAQIFCIAYLTITLLKWSLFKIE